MVKTSPSTSPHVVAAVHEVLVYMSYAGVEYSIHGPTAKQMSKKHPVLRIPLLGEKELPS